MNWKKLKDFCNSLPESELEKNVMIWREDADDVITDIFAEQLDEDHYVYVENEEYGCMPVSEVESLIRDFKEDYPNGLEHFRKVYDKGHPILHENF